MTGNKWECTRCRTSTVVDSAETAWARATQHVQIKHGGDATSVTFVVRGVRSQP